MQNSCSELKESKHKKTRRHDEKFGGSSSKVQEEIRMKSVSLSHKCACCAPHRSRAGQDVNFSYSVFVCIGWVGERCWGRGGVLW